MLKMVDGTGIIGVDMICPLGISTPQPPNYDKVELEGTGILVLPNSLDAPLERLELGGKTEGKKQVIPVGEIEQGTVTAHAGNNYPSDYRVRTKSYINLTSGVYEVMCTGAKLGNVIFYSAENKYEKMLSETHIPLPIKFTLEENKTVRILFSNSESTPIAPTDIKNAILEADVSPEHPQEIVNSGKWNEETQKYEVDVKVTNAEQNWSKEQTLTLTSDRSITKWDRLVEQGGEIGWLYGTKKYTITGNELFQHGAESYHTGSSTDMFYVIPDATDSAGIMNDLSFVKGIWNYTDKEAFCVNVNQLHVRLYNTRIGVSDDAAKEEKFKMYKAFMAKRYADGTPFEVYYKTTKSEFVPLSESEQNAIRALKTYYPTTVITADGGELDPDIKVTYRKEI